CSGRSTSAASASAADSHRLIRSRAGFACRGFSPRGRGRIALTQTGVRKNHSAGAKALVQIAASPGLEPLGGIEREIGQDPVGAGPLEAEERFLHRALALEPAALGGGGG